MFDVRNNLANAVSASCTTHFGDKVFRTIVPRNVRLAEAPSHGQSIVGYDRASRGGVAYLGLAGEILRRRERRKKQQRHMEHADERQQEARPGRGLEALLGPKAAETPGRSPAGRTPAHACRSNSCSPASTSRACHMDPEQADRAG
jgi:hypothetical protein